jgi:N-methylhydantoinase B
MSLPGGAGRGDPKERNPEAVLADVIDGYVSLVDAREVYLVAIEYGGDENALVRPPGTYSIDSAETRALRGQADCDQGVTVS